MTRALVVAKAPVAGRVKTRLGAEVGMEHAARVAAAALADTLAACADAFGARNCHLALAGDLAEAVEGPSLCRLLAGWTVHPQRGIGLGARLAAAHADAAEGARGATVVQVGMDTPQVTPALLREVGSTPDDAVLGPAEDGGWWVLALRRPEAATALADVPMSRPDTWVRTRVGLESRGLRVGAAAVLRDIDTVGDADAVADAAPGSRFARAWAEVPR